MSISAKRIAVLAKVEAQYGKDAGATGALNAILVSKPTLSPMESDRAERDVVRPYFGNPGGIPTGTRVKLEFEIELAGSGTKGVAPAWGVLIQACGFVEKVTADTKVDYSLTSSPAASLTMYCNFDGVNHVLLGARGTLSLDMQNKQLPKMKYTFTGLYGGVSDAAAPVVNLTKFMTPVPFDVSNVGAVSLHGYSPAIQQLSLDMANEVVHRALPGGTEEIKLTGRKPSGQVVIEATKVADKDWFSLAKAATPGALSVIHGKTAGNIIEISAPAVQFGNPTYSDADSVLMLNAPLTPVPVAGDDELMITVR